MANGEEYNEDDMMYREALATERAGIAAQSIQHLRQRATRQVGTAAGRMAKRIIVQTLLRVLAMLLLNPITWMVLGILALIAGIVLLTAVVLSAIGIF